MVPIRQAISRFGLVLLVFAVFPWSAAQGAACSSFSIYSWFGNFGPSGGSYALTITYTGPAGCTYSISADSWITLQGPTSGTWTGSDVVIPYTVVANSTTSPRTGSITDGVIVNANIAQNSSNCTFSFSPPSATYSAGGGSNSTTLNSSPAGCWAELNGPASWVTVGAVSFSAFPEVLPATVPYTVDANSGTARSTSISLFSDPSSSSTFPITQAGSSTTSCSATPNPSIWGQTVTLKATVSPPTATGAVTFSEGASTLASPSLSGGTATFSTNAFTVGPHSFIATYNGDALDSGSSCNFSLTVNKAPTSTSITSSPNPSTLGDTVTITASVIPAVATGTVTFQDGGGTIGSATVTNGTASITSSSLSPGGHSLTASYGGDIHYLASGSGITNQQVNSLNSSTSLTSSPNPSTFGQQVTLSATVSPSDATGTISFNDGAANYGVVNVSNGSASITVSSLGPGTHGLSANYSGDSRYGSSSGGVSQVVQKIQTSTSLANPGGAIQGQTISFTATVTPNSSQSPAPGGSVTFQDNFLGVSSSLGTASLNNGTANFSTNSLAIGTHSVTASYSGDGYYQNSTSSAVNAAITTAFTISSISPCTAPAGSSGFTLTINGAGFPSGATVQWNGTALTTTFVNAGQLTATVPASLIASAGTVTVTVASGATTSSTGVLFTVTPPAVPCSFTFTPPSATFGASGAAGSVQVNATRSDCMWTATANVPWITFPGSPGMTGSGTLNYSVATNAGTTTRDGTISVGQQTFKVTQGGVCVYTLSSSSQAFGSGGGSGSVPVHAPPGCPWTATSNSPSVTFPSGNTGTGDGALAFNAAPNSSTSSVNYTLTVANLSFIVTEDGTTPSLTCAASVPTPTQVALEGRTELLGDILLNCINIPTGNVNVDITLTLNTNVSNHLTNGVSDAVLTGNGTSQPGLITGYNVIRWLGVSLPSLSSSAAVQISKLRADASLLAAPGNPPAAITGQVSISFLGDVPVTGAMQTMAQAAPALVFTRLQAAAPSGGQAIMPVKFQESLAPSFTASVTRLRAAACNIPSNVQVYAPIFPSEGAARAQFYNADANGLGGSAQAGTAFAGGTYQQLTVANGCATATWLVLAADPLTVETWTFPLLFVGATVDDLNAITIRGTLAPLSDVTIASTTAPVPRYRDLTASPALVNLRMTSGIKTPGSSAPQSGSLIGTSQAFSPGNQVSINFAVQNDTSNQAATNVVVQGNLPTGLTLVSCTFLGSACGGSGHEIQTIIPQLPPGATDSGTIVAKVDQNVGDGTILDVTINSSSDEASEDLGASNSSTSVLVTTKPTLTLTTDPPGLKVVADKATPLPAPQTYNSWTAGSTHTISVPTPQNNSLDGKTQAVFTGWSDGDTTNPRTVTAPTVNVTYTAKFTTQYQLLTSVSPAGSGSVTASPSGTFINAGAQVVLTAAAAVGYSFVGWTGDMTSASNPLTVTMTGPLSLKANFSSGPPPTHFSVTAPSTAAAGTPIAVTLTALDANNNTVTAYSGTVHFTSTDPAAVLPTDAPLSGGKGTFSVALATAGSQTISVADAGNAALKGTSNTIAVSKAQLTLVPPNPASGVGSSQLFTFSFTDPAGVQDLSVVNILIKSALDAHKACYLAYVVQSKSLLLVNDDGDAGGPFAPGTQNSQCSVTLSGASTTGQTLALSLNITFTTVLAGNNIVYLAARDQAQNNTGWRPMGVWQVPFTPSGSIAVGTVNAQPQSVNVTISDTKGAGDLGVVDVLINSALDGRQACYIAYVPAANALLLVNDAGQAGGPYQGMVLNAGGLPIQNSQCTVSPSSSATSSGNTATLNLNITFSAGFTGSHIVYIGARDRSEGNNTGWQPMAVLTGQ